MRQSYSAIAPCLERYDGTGVFGTHISTGIYRCFTLDDDVRLRGLSGFEPSPLGALKNLRDSLMSRIKRRVNAFHYVWQTPPAGSVSKMKMPPIPPCGASACLIHIAKFAYFRKTRNSPPEKKRKIPLITSPKIGYLAQRQQCHEGWLRGRDAFQSVRARMASSHRCTDGTSRMASPRRWRIPDGST